MLLRYARCSASLLLSRCAHATGLYAVSCAAHFHTTRGALTCFPPAFLLHVAARCPALLPVNGLLIMRAVCSDWVQDRITQCPRKKMRMRGRASLHPGVLWQPRFLNCSPQSCNEGHFARFCGFWTAFLQSLNNVSIIDSGQISLAACMGYSRRELKP